jgi:apolipoprotein N-acyltransferase
MKLFEQRRWRWLAALASGLMLSRAVSLAPIWWLAWIAPAPLLIAAFETSAGEAFLLAFAAGVIQATSIWHLMMVVNGPVAVVIFTILFGLLWALAISLARAIVCASDFWLATLAYPTAWAAVDTLLVVLWPHGTYGSMAISQMNLLPLIQIASIAGSAGIVFLMSIAASMAAVAAHKPRRAHPLLAYGTPAVVLLLGYGYGATRLASPALSLPMRVAMVAIDRNDQTLDAAKQDPIWDRYLSDTDRLAGQGAKLVVFSEAIALLDQQRQSELSRRLSAEARARSIYLVAGLAAKDGALIHNRAWVFGPDGRMLVSYAKHHLAPGLDAQLGTPGTGYSTFDLRGHRIGIAICKDMDFPALPRHYRRLGVEALVVPASDFGEDGWLHSRIAVLRGVEDGFSVIRSGEFGLLTISDPYGRVLMQAPSKSGPGGTLMATLPLARPITTVYSRIGNLLGFASIAAIALWLVTVLLSRSRAELEAANVEAAVSRS